MHVLRTVLDNQRGILAQFMTVRKKQILASVSGMQKQNWGNHAFS